MNGLSSDGIALADEVTSLLKSQADPTFDLLVCPPFTLVSSVADAVQGSGVALGAQDCHTAESGANTGDISAPMLADLGCSYVIVGHSERRADHGESDALIKSKAAAALKAGLIAIICIGETEADRDAGKTFDVVKSQLAGSVPDGSTAANIVVAYEPVWAIGSGQKCRLLYGGSVKPENAPELMTLPDVDGGLIGGASLKSGDFWAIAQSCL